MIALTIRNCREIDGVTALLKPTDRTPSTQQALNKDQSLSPFLSL